MASTGLRSVKHKIANTILPFFFKSNCNLDNKCPLVIPLKFLASSSNSKVASTFKSKQNNRVVQLVCPSGLLTFIHLTAIDLSKFLVFAKEEDEPFLKKSKKNYDVFYKSKDI
jgi:hypothetical protein